MKYVCSDCGRESNEQEDCKCGSLCVVSKGFLQNIYGDEWRERWFRIDPEEEKAELRGERPGII